MNLPLAGALALASPMLVSATPPPIVAPSNWVYYHFVEQVICDRSFGTAFRIAPDRLVSVDHVTKATGCTIDNEPVIVESADPKLDFSIIRTATHNRNIVRYSCEGIKAGEWVHAIGHARGWPRQQMISLVSRGWKGADGMTVLHGAGTVIPGQSGGPVLNSRGEVVATVNAYNPWLRFSYVRELKDTELCKGASVV